MPNQFNLLQALSNEFSNCIFSKKNNALNSQKSQNFLHESYQINDKVYKSIKLNRKYPVIKCILGEKCEIRLARISREHIDRVSREKTIFISYCSQSLQSDFIERRKFNIVGYIFLIAFEKSSKVEWRCDVVLNSLL